MKNSVIINDKLLPEKKALVSVQERSFRFGDGVFESCVVVDGIVYNFESHLSRLFAGLSAIKIKHNFSNQQLKKLAYQLIAANKIKKGSLRISVSRGSGSSGYLPSPLHPQPLLVMETAIDPPKIPAEIKLWISSLVKPDLAALPVNYKISQGLNSTLARIEAFENGCFDGILCNARGEVCEAASANIFWVRDNQIFTPAEECGVLMGTIRQKIFELSPIKINAVKSKIDILQLADEVFISNSRWQIVAVDKIEPWNKFFPAKKYSQLLSNLIQQDIRDYVQKNHHLAGSA